MMSRNALWILGGLFLVAVFGVHFSQIRKLKGEIAALRTEISATPEVEVQAGNPQPDKAPLPIAVEGASIQARLSKLEQGMAELHKASQVLVEHGVMAPSEDRLAEMQQRLLDPNASDADRLRALRSLRRGNQMSDEVVAQGLNMLQTSTNMNFRREILQHLDGLTNASLKQPLMAMLSSETDESVRGQLVNNLRRFVDDPAVESKMWEVAMNEPNTRVRDAAREAIARAPAPPERVDQLRARAASQDASLDERLIAFRALRIAKSHTPELVTELATMAQNSSDPISRAKLFKSFNGLTDQVLMPPLVNGLQDSDPVVRQNAADALSSFSDPRVQEWLNHLIQNDADPTVKREAHRALEHSQRMSRMAP